MWIRQLQSLKIDGASVPAHLGACPPGHRIDRDRCFECFPGSYTSGQDSSCFLCPKNFFMPKFAADSCWPCPDGRKTLKYGSDSEDQCILLDSSGNKLLDTTHWIIIGASILSFFIVLIAVAIVLRFILRTEFWTKRSPEPKMGPDLKALEIKRIRSADDHVYDSLSLISCVEENESNYDKLSFISSLDEGEHVYEDLDSYRALNAFDDNETYMTPIKKTHGKLATDPNFENNLKRVLKRSPISKAGKIQKTRTAEQVSRKGSNDENEHSYSSLSFSSFSDGSEHSYGSIDNKQPMYGDLQGDQKLSSGTSKSKGKSTKTNLAEDLKQPLAEHKLKHPSTRFNAQYYCLTDPLTETSALETIGDMKAPGKRILSASKSSGLTNKPEISSENKKTPSILIDFEEPESFISNTEFPQGLEKTKEHDISHPQEQTKTTNVKDAANRNSKIPKLKMSLRSMKKQAGVILAKNKNKQLVKTESKPFKVTEDATIDMDSSFQQTKTADTTDDLKGVTDRQSSYAQNKNQPEHVIHDSQDQDFWISSGYLDHQNLGDGTEIKSPSSPVEPHSSSGEYCSTSSDPKLISTKYSSSDDAPLIPIELLLELPCTDAPPPIPPPLPPPNIPSKKAGKPGEKSRLFR